jgi:hypothetical protein
MMKQLRNAALACLALLIFIAGGCTFSTSTTTTGLKADDIEMAAEKAGAARSDHKFKKGETVWLRFNIEGFKQAADNDVWVQQDLDVTAPDGKNILHKDNILDLHQKAEKGASNVTATNEISLPATSAAGEYKVKVTLRDKIGEGTATHNFTFTVE